MLKVETSTLEDGLGAAPGGDADLRAVGRRVGTAGYRPAGVVGDRRIRAAVRTGERGAL